MNQEYMKTRKILPECGAFGRIFYIRKDPLRGPPFGDTSNLWGYEDSSYMFRIPYFKLFYAFDKKIVIHVHHVMPNAVRHNLICSPILV